MCQRNAKFVKNAPKTITTRWKVFIAENDKYYSPHQHPSSKAYRKGFNRSNRKSIKPTNNELMYMECEKGFHVLTSRKDAIKVLNLISRSQTIIKKVQCKTLISKGCMDNRSYGALHGKIKTEVYMSMKIID